MPSTDVEMVRVLLPAGTNTVTRSLRRLAESGSTVVWLICEPDWCTATSRKLSFQPSDMVTAVKDRNAEAGRLSERLAEAV